jgi:hypothetical protein
VNGDDEDIEKAFSLLGSVCLTSSMREFTVSIARNDPD